MTSTVFERDRLEVVLDSVLHDVVDVDDQLLQFGQASVDARVDARVDVSKVTVDVHGSPAR